MAFIGNVEKLAKWAGLNDPAVRQIMENVRRFPQCMESAEKILQSICMCKGINLADPPVFEVPANLSEEGVFMGHVLRGDARAGEFFLHDSELEGNIGIFGVTGSGKSMMARYLCENWIEQGLSVIIFDQSNEYISLLNRFGPEKLSLVRARQFPIGPFVNNPGSYLSDLANLSRVVSVFRESLFLRDGSHNLLLKTVGDMYRERGVIEGSGDYPVLTEVFNELVSRKFSAQSRHAGYLETLVNRFQWLLQSFPCFNARKPINPGELFKRSLIILMGDMSPEEQDFFINMFIHWLNTVLYGNIVHGIRIVMLLEEAHRTISEEKIKRYDMGEPQIIDELRTCRKYGMSMVIIDQIPSDLPTAVFGNLGMKIVFRLSDKPCINAIEDSMGLDREQRKKIGELPRRRAIVQTSGNPEPFLLEVPELPGSAMPTLDELNERIKLSMEYYDYELEDININLFLFGGKRKDSENGEQEAIGGDMLRVLVRICEAPYELIEERLAILNMDRAQEFRARQDLTKLGLIEKGEVLGSRWAVYIPTAKGVQWAEKAGFTVYRYKGSIAHEVMVKRVKGALENYSKDITVICEGEALGKSGVQPDMIVMVKDREGDTSRRVAVQLSYENKPDYEARRAFELCGIEQIDMVVLVAKNKKSSGSLERAVTRLNQGSLFEDRKHPAVPVRIIDFETCVKPDYDWSWILG